MKGKVFWQIFLSAVLAVGALAVPARAADLKAYWKDGIRLDTADETAKIKLGGRVMVDSEFAAGDNDLEAALGAAQAPPVASFPVTDGVEVRRLRLYAAGLLYGRVEFKDQLDFAGSKVSIKDAYVGLVKLPGGFGLRVGHFKEPFGLEELTSSKYISLQERSLPTGLFAPSRGFGWMLHNGKLLDGKASFAVGLFRPGSKVTGDDNAYSLTTRLTFAPLLENKGERLVHLGVAYSLREAKGDTVQYKEHPEVHLVSDLVDTGTLSGVEQIHLLGFEGAATFGSLSLQGEYTLALHDAPALGDPTLWGVYVLASYFVTGEHRVYKHGAFSRVKPQENFGKDGWGALELAARYSHANLNDGSATGGKQDTVSVGLNWYLNPNARILFNYVYGNVEDSPIAPNGGTFHAFQNRFQVDF